MNIVRSSSISTDLADGLVPGSQLVVNSINDDPV